MANRLPATTRLGGHRAREEVAEVIVHAGDAEVGLAVEGAPDVVCAVGSWLGDDTGRGIGRPAYAAGGSQTLSAMAAGVIRK
jgi:hypothetical protein